MESHNLTTAWARKNYALHIVITFLVAFYCLLLLKVEVAKHVPRKKSGINTPSGKLNIAAIDFGTINCSVAYTIVGSRNEIPVILALNQTYYRVPTAILFKPDGSIDSFGYEARAEYLDLDDEERLEYTYFEQIKMSLQYNKVGLGMYM